MTDRPVDERALDRMRASMVASWHVYADAAASAEVRSVGDSTAAIFPAGAAREVFNNALLHRDLDRDAAEATVAALEGAYAAAGVAGFAVWAQADDAGALAALSARGYRQEETTRPMLARLERAAGGAHGGGEAVGARGGGPSEHEVVVQCTDDPSEALPLNGVGADLFAAPPAGARWHVARDDGRAVSTALALVFDGDCQVSFVATHPDARRRGHAGRVLQRLLADAVDGGCTTASLQSTPVAESLYAAHGFRPLGRFVEWQRPA